MTVELYYIIYFSMVIFFWVMQLLSNVFKTEWTSDYPYLPKRKQTEIIIFITWISLIPIANVAIGILMLNELLNNENNK